MVLWLCGRPFHCSDLSAWLAHIQPLRCSLQTAWMDDSLLGLMGIGSSFLTMFVCTANWLVRLQSVSQSVAEHSHQERGHWKPSPTAPLSLLRSKPNFLPCPHSTHCQLRPHLILCHSPYMPGHVLPRAFALSVFFLGFFFPPKVSVSSILSFFRSLLGCHHFISTTLTHQ